MLQKEGVVKKREAPHPHPTSIGLAPTSASVVIQPQRITSKQPLQKHFRVKQVQQQLRGLWTAVVSQ